MIASEIIRSLMDIVDKKSTATEPKLANSPDERTLDAETVFSMGDDVHKPKNPSDIRTNAPSMYPGYQAEKK